MRRNSGAINYVAGMATSRVGLINMYIYGGSVLSLLTFVLGLAASGSVSTAMNVVLDFYIARLVPWPFDELLFAETIFELILSHGVTISVGLLFASAKWWVNA